MIKTIIFDLGRVIIPFDFDLGYAELSRLSRMDTALIRERIRATGLVPQFETGLIEPEPFVAGIAAALGIEISVEEFRRIWNLIFLEETLIPEDLVVRLKRHYKVLLLSNTNALHFDGLAERYPLLRHFDHHVLSYKVRVMKPDAEIYLHAARLAGCEASECLFIDDLEENVKGAQAVGMQALVFHGREQLEREFQEIGIVY